MKRILCTIALILALVCVVASCNKSPEISISEDGYWVINGEKTDVKAQGEKGDKGDKGDSATATDENPLGLTFFLKDDGTYAVEIGQAKYLSKIEIPATYKGKAVTEVGSFSSEILKGITIPDSVTSIGNSALSRCTSLTSVTIPDSVTNIGDSAFYNCTSLTSVTIGDNVTSIGYRAFYQCTSLTSITIPDSVTSIGDSAFSYCFSLTSVVIPNSVTSIGDSAFSYCSSLTSITIPDSVTSIGDSAFERCTVLMSITIPNSVTSIGADAFSGCSSLTSITFKGTVEQWNAIMVGINWEANTLVKQIVCSDGIVCLEHTIIVDEAVAPTCTEKGLTEGQHCSACNEVLVLQEVIDALSHNYTSTLIPPTSTEDAYALFTCSVCGDTYTEAKEVIDFTITADNREMVGYTRETGENLIIPSVFENGGVCYRVTSIGEYAFYDCSSLTSITIPDSVTSIGDSAFLWCTSLTSITIPDSVTSIGNSAFFECRALTSITIPDSVTSIGRAAFVYCKALTSVTFANPNGWWHASSADAISGTAISADSLSNTYTAARFLKDNLGLGDEFLFRTE